MPVPTAAPTHAVRPLAEGPLREHEVYALLASVGIAVPAHVFAPGEDLVTAEDLARLGSDEVVVKVVSEDIVHKSDVGGVVRCPSDLTSVRATIARMREDVGRLAPGARVAGALVVERVAHQAGLGVEILAGFRHDPAFGPVVILGVGGLDTEYLLASLAPDRARALMPAESLTAARALERLRGTLVHASLCGFLRSRRQALVREDKLVQLAVALGELARRHAGFTPLGLALAELEVNPLVVSTDSRLVAIDGRARAHRPEPLAPLRRVADLRRLLEPRSAAVIGASAESANAGRVILGNLVRGGGVARDQIVAVHPRAASIEGCRAVASLDALEEPVDLAVVALPADKGADRAVIEIVEKRRARSITLITGGFGETEKGREMESRMRRAIEESHRAADGGVLVNGGNCLGIVSVPGGYNTFFLPPHKLPFHDAAGQNVASISQSGAYLVSQISNLDHCVRPRYAISFGNQMDVTVGDYLEYLEGDEAVRVFACYVEGFRAGDGARFLEVAARLGRAGRPVLVYKAGRTREGRAAAASHTAAAVGDHEVWQELAAQAGVIDCQTLNMLEDYVMAFAFLDGRPRGRRVAILSNAGYECTAAADRLYGLQLASVGPATRARLAELLPAGIVDVHNPVDATPMTTTAAYADMVQALVDDPGVDAVVVAGVPASPYLENLEADRSQHGEDIARPESLPSRLIAAFRSTTKPMVFSVDSGPLYEPCVQMMLRAGLPCFRKVDRATRALSAFVGR